LSVGVDNIPGCIINGCADIFVPILKHIFNLGLFQQYFPTLWKQAAIVPVIKKGKSTSVSNYRPISLLNNFSKIFNMDLREIGWDGLDWIGLIWVSIGTNREFL
jgi:hypothetical protein